MPFSDGYHFPRSTFDESVQDAVFHFVFFTFLGCIILAITAVTLEFFKPLPYASAEEILQKVTGRRLVVE